MYTVSVDQAISRGRKKVLIPQLLIFIGLPLITYLLSANEYLIILSPAVVLFAALLAGIYRAYAIPSWMIWAFANVRNVHELKRRAEFAYLIPGELNKGFRKFEVWSNPQRLQWAQLQYRFDQADEFISMPALPPETRIYFSKVKQLLSVAMGLIVFGFGAAELIFNREEFKPLSSLWAYFIGILFMAIGIYLTRSSFIKLINRKAQIIMNDKGIETSGSPFQPWSAVLEIAVVGKGIRYRIYYLRYWVNGVEINIELEGLTAGRRKIDQLLRAYRGAFMQRMGTASIKL